MAKIIPLSNGTVREAINHKASVLFKRKGFNATSMRDIAKVMGVEAPSLYNHIASKKEILREICFRIAELYNTNINTVDAGNHPSLTKVDLILRFHIRMMLEEFEGVYIVNHEWKNLSEPYLSNFRNQRNNYQKRLAHIIELGIIDREINNVNPRVAVLTILSAIGGIESWHRSNKRTDVKSLEEDMVKILLQGLRNDKSPGSKNGRNSKI